MRQEFIINILVLSLSHVTEIELLFNLCLHIITNVYILLQYIVGILRFMINSYRKVIRKMN